MDTQSTQYASILCIGDELLDGRVSDKNIAPLSRVCAAHNIAVQQAMFTRDDRGSLMTALQWLQRQKPSWVLITGGLGPTEDDRTREEAAAFFDAPLEHDAKAMEIIEARFKARQKQVTENNLKQAMFPRGATIIYSEVGTASGFMITKESTSYIFMPGVPREVAWFCEQRLGDIINQSKEQVKGFERFIDMDTHLCIISKNKLLDSNLKIGFEADHVNFTSYESMTTILSNIH